MRKISFFLFAINAFIFLLGTEALGKEIPIRTTIGFYQLNEYLPLDGAVGDCRIQVQDGGISKVHRIIIHKSDLQKTFTFNYNNNARAEQERFGNVNYQPILSNNLYISNSSNISSEDGYSRFLRTTRRVEVALTQEELASQSDTGFVPVISDNRTTYRLIFYVGLNNKIYGATVFSHHISHTQEIEGPSWITIRSPEKVVFFCGRDEFSQYNYLETLQRKRVPCIDSERRDADPDQTQLRRIDRDKDLSDIRKKYNLFASVPWFRILADLRDGFNIQVARQLPRRQAALRQEFSANWQNLEQNPSLSLVAADSLEREEMRHAQRVLLSRQDVQLNRIARSILQEQIRSIDRNAQLITSEDEHYVTFATNPYEAVKFQFDGAVYIRNTLNGGNITHMRIAMELANSDKLNIGRYIKSDEGTFAIDFVVTFDPQTARGDFFFVNRGSQFHQNPPQPETYKTVEAAYNALLSRRSKFLFSARGADDCALH